MSRYEHVLIRSCRISRWACAHEQLWKCAHTLIAQNCSRHDFENVTKSIRGSSSLNGPYRHMRGQSRSMFNYVKLLYFCNKWFITLICVPIYASKAVSWQHYLVPSQYDFVFVKLHLSPFWFLVSIIDERGQNDPLGLFGLFGFFGFWIAEHSQ